MYTAQVTIDRIQTIIRSRGLVQKEVLADCGLNENTLKRMTDNRGMASFSLAKIADYLNVSVDYLLGRTDEPEVKSMSNVVSIGGNNIGAINNAVSFGKASTEDIGEVVEMFKSLTLIQRSEIILMMGKMQNQDNNI
ncbi:MAG: helix-turn-helix domain-containing protein [Prevotella sp.]|nr:helix-turn-helix domain-containing protein [Alistipes senegalensis]MCM1358758.1 helix-turn-helix domain-containing protein [Prevotella sp.]